MKIDIIILHFGPIKTTQICVSSVLKNESGNFSTLYVVNNDKEKISEENFGNVKNIVVINNPRNVGFAAGVNVGIKAAIKNGAEAVFLINNDAKISNSVLNILTKDLEENERLGAVSPTIEFRKDKLTLYDLGGYVNMHIGKTRHNNVEKILTDVLQSPQYISGCCMLIRKDVFESVGYFDERFFLYYEDVDFCLRMKKKKWIIALDPRVILFHSLSKSAGKGSRLSIYHQTRSAFLFGRKYFGFGLKRLGNLLFIFLQSNMFFLKNPAKGFAAFTAITDVLMQKPL